MRESIQQLIIEAQQLSDELRVEKAMLAQRIEIECELSRRRSLFLSERGRSMPQEDKVKSPNPNADVVQAFPNGRYTSERMAGKAGGK